MGGLLLQRHLPCSFSASSMCFKKYFASLCRILKSHHFSGRNMFAVFLFKKNKNTYMENVLIKGRCDHKKEVNRRYFKDVTKIGCLYLYHLILAS